MTITCPKYESRPGSKRCSHYTEGGACDLPDEMMCVEWLKTNEPKTHTNKHLSYSRIRCYEECPKSFWYRYVSGLPKPKRVAPQLTFGKIVHRVMELLYLEQKAKEKIGPLSVDRALELYQAEWKESALAGAELYDEGIRQLRGAIATVGPVDHRLVLGVEKGFELQAGRHKIIGYIDLLERDGFDAIVTDYKTGALPQPWDVDGTLQLTLYDIAVRQMYPRVRDVRLCLHQTRQGARLWTSRTDEQRAAALQYMELMGDRTESDTTWEATPGAGCGICSYRGECQAFKAVAAAATAQADPGDLDAVAREHLELQARAKAIGTRARETEKILKSALKHEEQIKAGGATWSFWPLESLTYKPTLLAPILEREGLELEAVMGVDNAKLKRAMDRLGDRGEMVRMEIDATATKRVFPRLWGRK